MMALDLVIIVLNEVNDWNDNFGKYVKAVIVEIQSLAIQKSLYYRQRNVIIFNEVCSQTNQGKVDDLTMKVLHKRD